MSESNSEDKSHEPTQKKLEDARKKGEVPRSSDLNTAASYAGFLVCGSFLGGVILVDLSGVFVAMIEQSNELSASVFSGHSQAIFGSMILGVLTAIFPWFALPALFVLLSTIAQQSFIVAPQKLQPKASRISILANAKNKFGRSGLFEFSKSFFKLAIISGVLGYFLMIRMPEIVGSIQLPASSAIIVLLKMCLSFLLIVLAISLAIGMVDFFWQRAEHTRKNRMSRQEVVDEGKQAEGDPHQKQQRRQRGYEIAMNKMLAEVPKADVVIVNPLHFAVALKWNRSTGSAPVCVAKGADEIAARIRQIAGECGVPVHRDPPTTRAVFATVSIGEEIRPDHYQAVAAAIRFADAMAKKVNRSK